jgi:hypothetical protein
MPYTNYPSNPTRILDLAPMPLRDDPEDNYPYTEETEYNEFGDPLDVLELQNNAWITGLH